MALKQWQKLLPVRGASNEMKRKAHLQNIHEANGLKADLEQKLDWCLTHHSSFSVTMIKGPDLSRSVETLPVSQWVEQEKARIHQAVERIATAQSIAESLQSVLELRDIETRINPVHKQVELNKGKNRGGGLRR